ARVALLAGDELEPGASGWAQVRLAQPLVAARGGRFIVRVPSPSLTIGGGVGVHPFPPRPPRRGAAVLGWLATLAEGSRDDIVLVTLRGGPELQRAAGARAARLGNYGGRELAEAARLVSMPAPEVAAALGALVARGTVVHTGALYFA